MKKFIVLLAASLLALGLASCKGSGDAEKISYSVTIKNTKIELSKDAAPVLTALGTSISSTDLGDCGGLGKTTKYVYDNFEIEVREKDKRQYISAIALKDDFYKTADGITIGSTRADVESAYGEPTSKSDDKRSYTYRSGDKRLTIRFGTKENANENQIVNLEFIYGA